MQYFGMRYFRNNLAEVLDLVAEGQTIALTRETRRSKNALKEPTIVALVIPPAGSLASIKQQGAKN